MNYIEILLLLLFLPPFFFGSFITNVNDFFFLFLKILYTYKKYLVINLLKVKSLLSFFVNMFDNYLINFMNDVLKIY